MRIVRGGVKPGQCGGVKVSHRQGVVVVVGCRVEGPLERSGSGPSTSRLVRGGLAICGWGTLTTALLEAIAVEVHFQDSDVMGEPVGAEDFRPPLKEQVRGNQGWSRARSAG